VPLPELSVGDRVYFLHAGAYTLSYASSFNGFAPPSVHVLDDHRTRRDQPARQPALASR